MDKLKLCKLVQKFGLIKGARIYNALKNHKNKIYIPGIKHEIYIRPHTKDVDTLFHILVEQELNINSKNKPQVIIDAGAFAGFSSIYFANVFPEATIIAIEPDIENFSQLTINTKKYSNIIRINKALWHTDGLALNLSVDNSHLGSHISNHKTGQKIESISLNYLVKKYNIKSIDLLKIDIEGAEKEIFRKNTDWLAITKKILIELHDRKTPGCSKQLMEALTNYDFTISPQAEYLYIQISH